MKKITVLDLVTYASVWHLTRKTDELVQYQWCKCWMDDDRWETMQVNLLSTSEHLVASELKVLYKIFW